jgi:hypothetical protein
MTNLTRLIIGGINIVIGVSSNLSGEATGRGGGVWGV